MPSLSTSTGRWPNPTSGPTPANPSTAPPPHDLCTNLCQAVLDHSIYLGSDVIIRGNACFRAAGWGLHLYSGDYSRPSGQHVYNNVCFQSPGGVVESGPNNVIAHNVCARNSSSSGIMLFRGGSKQDRYV